jgi:hypothetical protein
MTNKITKLALIGALLVSTISAASAQTFNGSQDNQPAYSQQQAPTDSPPRYSEGGGA